MTPVELKIVRYVCEALGAVEYGSVSAKIRNGMLRVTHVEDVVL